MITGNNNNGQQLLLIQIKSDLLSLWFTHFLLHLNEQHWMNAPREMDRVKEGKGQ